MHALLRLGSDKCEVLLSATIKEKENLGRSPFWFCKINTVAVTNGNAHICNTVHCTKGRQ